MDLTGRHGSGDNPPISGWKTPFILSKWPLAGTFAMFSGELSLVLTVHSFAIARCLFLIERDFHSLCCAFAIR